MLCVLTGPIAAGKSTILQELEERGATVVYESWADHPLLHAFYRDPKAHAYDFQMYILDHYESIAHGMKDPSAGPVFVERSPVDVLRVFLPANRGHMTPEQYRLCEQRTQELLRGSAWRDAYYVCLRVDPDMCCARIVQRRRTSECEYSTDYFKSICAAYDSLQWDAVYPNATLEDAHGIVSILERRIPTRA